MIFNQISADQPANQYKVIKEYKEGNRSRLMKTLQN